MITAISGGRNRKLEEHELRFIERGLVKGDKIHVGDARGVDASVREYFQDIHVEFKADWKLYRQGAGPVRNGHILKEADHLIAFPSKNSKGTWDAIRQAFNKEIRITIVNEDHKIFALRASQCR